MYALLPPAERLPQWMQRKKGCARAAASWSWAPRFEVFAHSDHHTILPASLMAVAVAVVYVMSAGDYLRKCLMG